MRVHGLNSEYRMGKYELSTMQQGGGQWTANYYEVTLGLRGILIKPTYLDLIEKYTNRPWQFTKPD